MLVGRSDLVAPEVIDSLCPLLDNWRQGREVVLPVECPCRLAVVEDMVFVADIDSFASCRRTARRQQQLLVPVRPVLPVLLAVC